MFVKNKTSFKVRLSRGRLVDERAVASLVLGVGYQHRAGTLTRTDEPPPPLQSPPDTSDHPLWEGTSVTGAGEIRSLNGDRSRRTATFMVGRNARQLAVFGNRRWVRARSGALEPSSPEPLDRITLSFDLAFGGSFDLAPGLFPGTDLPFPGGRIGYSPNEGGVGFYLDEQGAEGRALPNFELCDQLIRRWDDRPVPGCFVPCPELRALRTPPARGAPADMASAEAIVSGIFRDLHHAPGYLIFDELPPGTPIGLDGVGAQSVRFELPVAPARVRLRGGTNNEPRPRLRSVHVDTERAIITCVWGYTFVYADGRAPSWVIVES